MPYYCRYAKVIGVKQPMLGSSLGEESHQRETIWSKGKYPNCRSRTRSTWRQRIIYQALHIGVAENIPPRNIIPSAACSTPETIAANV